MREGLAAEDALSSAKAVLAVDNHRLYKELARATQANCLARLRRYDEAKGVMQERRLRILGALPAGHFERRLYLQTLAEISEGLGQPEKAAEYRALLREAEPAGRAPD